MLIPRPSALERSERGTPYQGDAIIQLSHKACLERTGRFYARKLDFCVPVDVLKVSNFSVGRQKYPTFLQTGFVRKKLRSYSSALAAFDQNRAQGLQSATASNTVSFAT